MKVIAGRLGLVCVVLCNVSEARAQDVQAVVEELATENDYQDADLLDLYEKTGKHASRLDAQEAVLKQVKDDSEGSGAQRIKALAEQVSGVIGGSVSDATATVLEFAVDGLASFGEDLDALAKQVLLNKGDIAFARGEFKGSYDILEKQNQSQDTQIDAIRADLEALVLDQADQDGAIALLDSALIDVSEQADQLALELGKQKKITLESANGEIYLTVGDTGVSLASAESVKDLERQLGNIDGIIRKLEDKIAKLDAASPPPPPTIGVYPVSDGTFGMVQLVSPWQGTGPTQIRDNVDAGAPYMPSETEVLGVVKGILEGTIEGQCWEVFSLADPSKPLTAKDGYPLSLCTHDPRLDYKIYPGEVTVDPLQLLAFTIGTYTFTAGGTATMESPKIDLNP